VKLLMLSRYQQMGASSRLRMFQYLPALRAAGIETEVAAFFDDQYLADLYAGRRRPVRTAKYYLDRALRLLGRRDADILWVEKELFPWLPWGVERYFLQQGGSLVTDYDDAVFHRYDLSPMLPVRAALGRKIDSVMAASNLVLAGNPYLAERASQAGAERIELVPTVVDVELYEAKWSLVANDGPRIGWIGTPGTWRQYVLPMMPMLSEVAAVRNASIRAVGAKVQKAVEGPFEFLPWSEDNEGADIRAMDIGIMPLDDTPWSRGKCGYKLIQYMACGLPVVASPVGVNSEIVEHGVNGFLASTEREWRDALATLTGDAALRRRMGAAGRSKVQRNYSLQVYGPKVAALIKGVVEGRPRSRAVA